MKAKETLIKAAGSLVYSSSTHRYLFLLRSADRYTDTWGIVGGKVEGNESIINCLRRETREELGFEPTVLKTIPIDLFISPDGKFEYHTFVCIVAEEFVPQLNDEHKGYCWTTLDGLPKPLHPGVFNAMSLEELRAKLAQNQDKTWS